MQPFPAPVDPRLASARQRVIAELCEHFAADHLSDTELEQRIDLAHRAAAMDELRSLLADLPALASPAAAAPADPRRAREVPDQQTVVAVMAGAARRGVWTVPRRLHVFAVMGGAELDLRDAVFGTGETEIVVFAMMGGIELVVPPELEVEVNVVPVMGGVEQGGDPLRGGSPGAPRIRVKGMVLMGGVDIQVRLRGESAGDARKRRRLERKQQKHLP